MKANINAVEAKNLALKYAFIFIQLPIGNYRPNSFLKSPYLNNMH